MTDVITRTEIAKLARLLGTDADSLAHLARLGPEPLAVLRTRMSAQLFDGLASTFDRVNRLAPLMPNALVVSVVHKVVPPGVAGRAGGAVGLAHRSRISGVIAGLRPQYLADAAPYLDPRVIPILASELDPDVIVPTAEILLARGDFITASEFVDHAPDDLIVQLTARINNDAGLLRTVAAISDHRLNQVLLAIPVQRLISIALSAAGGDDEVVLEAVSVLSRTVNDLGTTLANEVIERLEVAAIDRVLSVAAAGDHIRELLDVFTQLRDDVVARVALTDAVADEAFRAQAQRASDTDTRRRSWARIIESAGVHSAG